MLKKLIMGFLKDKNWLGLWHNLGSCMKILSQVLLNKLLGKVLAHMNN